MKFLVDTINALRYLYILKIQIQESSILSHSKEGDSRLSPAFSETLRVIKMLKIIEFFTKSSSEIQPRVTSSQRLT
jgi:hypothetical protein